MDIRNRIRRERLGLSQKKFAELMHVDVSSVRRWENSPFGVVPDRISERLDDMIATQERDAKRILDTFGETQQPIIALLWPNQKEMERQYGHPTSLDYEQENANTAYFAQLLEHEGHVIEYRNAPVLDENGKPDPAYEQDGMTLFVLSGEVGENMQTLQTLTRLLSNDGEELQQIVGRLGEHAYSTVAMPMGLYDLESKWQKELEERTSHLSYDAARVLVWTLIAHEADMQRKYAIHGSYYSEDIRNLELASGLSKTEIDRINDDSSLEWSEKGFFLSGKLPEE